MRSDFCSCVVQTKDHIVKNANFEFWISSRSLFLRVSLMPSRRNFKPQKGVPDTDAIFGKKTSKF